MDTQRDYEKEHTHLREDWWCFVIAVGRHGHSLVTLFSGFGILWILEKWGYPIPPWTVPWIVAFSVVVGAFISWRTERDTKEKAQSDLKSKLDELAAVPNIAGTWVRFNDTLTMRIEQTGAEIKSKFTYDNVDHELTGSFDFKMKKFITTTYRKDNKMKVQNQTTMRAAFALLTDDKDLLAFYSLGTDGKGLPERFPESAVYWREKGERP